MRVMSVSNGVNITKTTILVDLGGIFVHPPINYKLATGQSSVKLGRILSSGPWMDYEIGKINEDECFLRIAEIYGFTVEDLRNLVLNLRQTLTYDEKMLSLFEEIKQTPGIAIYLVSNISEPEYKALRSRWDDSFWNVFDGIFTSWMLGVRKPSLKFYQDVLRALRVPPQEALFIDDQPENLLTAMSFGMRGIFGNHDLSRTLKNAIGDPVERGLAFLEQYAGRHYSITNEGVSLDENYAQLLILEATQNK